MKTVSAIIIIIIIIIINIFVITLMRGIYIYIPDTTSLGYTVAAVLCLQFVQRVVLLRMLDMFCTTSLVLSAVCICGAQYGCFFFFVH